MRLHMGTCLLMSVNECTFVGATQSRARTKWTPKRVAEMHDDEHDTSRCTFGSCRTMTLMGMSACLLTSMNEREW